MIQHFLVFFFQYLKFLVFTCSPKRVQMIKSSLGGQTISDCFFFRNLCFINTSYIIKKSILIVFLERSRAWQVIQPLLNFHGFRTL